MTLLCTSLHDCWFTMALFTALTGIGVGFMTLIVARLNPISSGERATLGLILLGVLGVTVTCAIVAVSALWRMLPR